MKKRDFFEWKRAAGCAGANSPSKKCALTRTTESAAKGLKFS
ncbi:MAG TPA: hypothetical protein VGM13_13025 [Thermoanaerobaculia bacterium]|jgi:hypothetical protein